MKTLVDAGLDHYRGHGHGRSRRLRCDLTAAGAVHHGRQGAFHPVQPGAGHVDLYDRVKLIPFDELSEFFRGNLS
jgi:hypothetical protein